MGLNEYIKIGNRIKKLRKDKNISQKDMANMLNIPRSTYSNYENNNREPSIKLLEKIAEILNVSLGELFGVNEEELKKDLEETEALDLLLQSKGYKASDFTEEEYKDLERLVLEIIELKAYKLKHDA